MTLVVAVVGNDTYDDEDNTIEEATDSVASNDSTEEEATDSVVRNDTDDDEDNVVGSAVSFAIHLFASSSSALPFTINL